MATTSLNIAAEAAITITLTSLADGGYRESAAVDNSSNLYLDAMVQGSIQVGAVAADGVINVFGYGSIDAANAIYSGGLAGTDETITWGTTPSTSSVEGFNNIPLLGVVSVDTTDDNNDIEFGALSVAAGFGGVMPESWGVVINNETGTGLHATGSNNVVEYAGIKYDSA